MVKAIKVMLIPNNVQKTIKKAENSFQMQNSEKNLQSLDILMNMHGY